MKIKFISTVFIFFLFTQFSFAEIIVKGLVTDSNNKPLTGVAVTVKNIHNSTITAPDGTFVIKEWLKGDKSKSVKSKATDNATWIVNGVKE